MPNPTALSDIAKQIKEIQLKILSAEGEINNTSIIQSQEIEALESQLKQKTEIAITLKREIDILERNNKLEVDCNASPDINLLHDQHAQALEGLQNNQKLLEEFTESTELKKVELQEKETEISALSEQLCAAKEQLKAYNSVPLSEHSKGNSLFAQVHDRCMLLEENVEQMKLKYKHGEQELKRQERTILTLHKDNNRLRATWKTDLQQKECALKFAGESSIDELAVMENRMEELQLRLAEGATKVTTKVYFSQVTLQEKCEIFELGKKMSVQSKEVCGLAVDPASAKNEMRLLNFRALELAQQIEEAKQ
ncbi:protein Spindly-B [Dendroctonus ponderosae]|uniref:protein Spindly-B n=1 Tax=Dendroctonus ponderosae TaxID=77166 RepID=UPI002035A83F|nr:protein Spindly-B [Dendroctonus ponderosae]